MTREPGPHAVQSLPPPDVLEHRARVLAVLDALLCPDWEYRYYSFNARWAPSQWMASMRDGSGSHWFLVGIDGVGLGLTGLALHTPAFRMDHPRPGIVDRIPQALHAHFLEEPAFDMKNTTFTGWWLDAEPGWHAGTCGLEDGADDLLSALLGGPDAYHAFAEEYYERTVDPTVVAELFAGGPVLRSTAEALNPDLDWEAFVEEAPDMGVETRE
ncbi:MAG: hypothetical protein R3F61_19965 [Myxococcota bacterium]